MKKWQESSSSNKCKICDKRLIGGIINSDKVHCRVCGAIVCQECSQRTARYLPILEGTPFINSYPKYIAMHVCDRCYKDPLVLFIDESCPDNASDELKKIHKFAKDIVVSANLNFPVSGSRQRYYKDYDPNLHSSKAEQKDHQEDSGSILRRYKTNTCGAADNDLSGIEGIIRHCLKVSIANCFEMALYGYLSVLYATKHGGLNTMSYGVYDLPLGDHMFLLIAPIGEVIPSGISNSENFKQAHCNIIVCDPWRKMIFFLRNMSKYMGRTIISNRPAITMSCGDHCFTKYHSMRQLQDSIFKNSHRTTIDN